MLRESGEYLANVRNRFRKSGQTDKCGPVRSGITTFVFVIPTEKAGPLPQCMFFFSLMNLLDHSQVIRRTGFNVALCKVDYMP